MGTTNGDVIIPRCLHYILGAKERPQKKDEALGGPMNPVYAFGPGTIWAYFKSYKGPARVSSSLEGIF